MPALLFGCIPIHMNSIFHPPSLEVPTALPLEEVLGWHRFGTRRATDMHHVFRGHVINVHESSQQIIGHESKAQHAAMA